MEYTTLLHTITHIIMQGSQGDSFSAALAQTRQICAHVLGISQSEVLKYELSNPHIDNSAAQLAVELAQERARGLPLQYVLGVVEFYGAQFEVGPGVFIPRPETELLAQHMARHIQRSSPAAPRVLDVCTGSGILAITAALQGAKVTALDCDPIALDYARRNADRNKVQVDWICGRFEDVLPIIEDTFELVVANPPYVPDGSEVSPEVKYDPPHAVYSGKDGLDCIRLLVPLLVATARSGGSIVLEHDASQGESVAQLLADQGLIAVTGIRDLAGFSRLTHAVKP